MACGSLKLSPGTWFQVGCHGIWVLGAGEVPNCGALEGPFLQRLDWLVWPFLQFDQRAQRDQDGQTMGFSKQFPK